MKPIFDTKHILKGSYQKGGYFFMGNISNDEVFDGMRQMEQVMRPLVELAKIILEELKAKTKAINRVLQNVMEKNPDQFEPYVKDTFRQLEQQSRKEASIAGLNGKEELEYKSNQIIDTYKQDIEINLKAAKDSQSHGIHPTKEIERISGDLAGIGQLREELKKDNHEFFNGKNYENTMNKMQDIVENSPIKGQVQFDLNQSKSKSIAEEVMDKPGSLARKFKEAIEEAKAFNLAKPQSPQKAISQAMERVL